MMLSTARNALTTSMRAGGAQSRVQTRGMAENLKDILTRINSTNNIQKITKSMKMVSAAKLRGDTDRLMNGRPFGASVDALFNATPTEEDENVVENASKPLYVVISSDRGLCGGVNSFVAKATKLAIAEDIEKGLDPAIFVLGDKGHGALSRLFPERLIGQVHECWKTPINFDKTLLMVDRILSAAPEGTDQFKIVYNQYISAINYDTTMKNVLNVPKFMDAEDESSAIAPFPFNKYEGELESTEEGLQNAFEFGFSTTLYGCMIESATSEQSARMTAMDGASKNAAEMVEKLTIRYNRARQAKITTELIEIISGAESLEG